MTLKSISFLVVLLLSGIIAWAQQPAFYNDIREFKKQDSAKMPPANAILFVGSSSFTKWKDVQDYFPGKPIINRGFGGSTLPDVIRYANDIIYPYKSKQVVIYCGENDLASSDTVSAAMVFDRFKTLYTMIRENLPKANIAFVSLKPSPSRKHLWTKMEAANELIKNFIETKKNTVFIDVYHPMFNADGSVKQELFIEDNLHMKPEGYALWKGVIAPYLL